MPEHYTDFWEVGAYHCAQCGHPLFESETKFKSGTQWPSFRKVMPGATATQSDHSLGMERTELLCANCRQHLGHVFDDGKSSGDTHPEAGKRYCILSDALDFRKRENKR